MLQSGGGNTTFITPILRTTSELTVASTALADVLGGMVVLEAWPCCLASLMDHPGGDIKREK